MADKSTPTPWILGSDGIKPAEKTPFWPTIAVMCEPGFTAMIPAETQEANAALIVRAVNRDHLFGELVEALEDIAAHWNGSETQTAMSDACLHNVEIARAALAKVEASDG